MEFSFNYHNLFLLKKQSQYAQKFSCVKLFYNAHVILHPFKSKSGGGEGGEGCLTTKLKMFYNVEPLQLKLPLS